MRRLTAILAAAVLAGSSCGGAPLISTGTTEPPTRSTAGLATTAQGETTSPESTAPSSTTGRHAVTPARIVAGLSARVFVGPGADADVDRLRTLVEGTMARRLDLKVIVLGDETVSAVDLADDVARIVKGTVLVFTPSGCGVSTSKIPQEDLTRVLEEAEGTLGTSDAATALDAFLVAASALWFGGEPGSPVAELTSFSGSTEVTMTVGDIGHIRFASSGTYTTAVYRCETVVNYLGLPVTLTAIATPDRQWIDLGDGFGATTVSNSNYHLAIELCPAAPSFWADYTPILPIGAQDEVLDDLPTRRVEPAGVPVFFGDFTIAGFEFDQLTVWLADPGRWPVQMTGTFVLSPDEASQFLDWPTRIREPVSASVTIRITNADDPSLVVKVPAAPQGIAPVSGSIENADVAVGDCFNGYLEASISEIVRVPCDLPHEYEVYHEFQVTGEEYPGTWTTRKIAVEGCLSQFETLEGRDYQLSELDVAYLYPSAESWRNGDQAVMCVAFDTTGADLVGNAVGSTG